MKIDGGQDLAHWGRSWPVPGEDHKFSFDQACLRYFCTFLTSPSLAGRFFTASAPWEAQSFLVTAEQIQKGKKEEELQFREHFYTFFKIPCVQSWRRPECGVGVGFQPEFPQALPLLNRFHYV